jgi:hypothetical protein
MLKLLIAITLASVAGFTVTDLAERGLAAKHAYDLAEIERHRDDIVPYINRLAEEQAGGCVRFSASHVACGGMSVEIK